MALNLTRKDYEFNNTRICQIMPKLVQLDRVLINLYMLLKHDGRRPVLRTGRKAVTLDLILEQLAQHNDKLIGFQDYREVVREWIYSDLIDVVYRGVPDKQTVAAPLPLHLNAYKLRNPKQANDYRGAEHLYSLLRAGDPDVAGRLAKFLGQGMDPESDTYDGETLLELDTLIIVRMVDNPNLREDKPSKGDVLDPPLCKGQARLLADDLRRLLAYEGVIPRSVLIGYLRTAFGLHLSLYQLRLFHQLAGWVNAKQAHSACLNCPVQPGRDEQPFGPCPYAFQNQTTSAKDAMFEIVVDMGEDHNSHMAQLSRDNCSQHYSHINDYIQAVFTVNQVKRYAESDRGRRELGDALLSIDQLVALLQQPPEGMQGYFSDRIDDIAPSDIIAGQRPEIQAVYGMSELSAFDRFIALVSLERAQYYRRYLVDQLDSMLMKNQDFGLLRQGKGKRHERRWHLGSRLLEMLVQIAILESVDQKGTRAFCSRPILIDQFSTWLRDRYGLVLMPTWPDATIEDYTAFNSNLRLLKDRLREIGFYIDLSDAYNTQTIRPRYIIDSSAVKA